MRPARRPRLRRTEQGFTMLELMISSTVFLLVAGAVVTALVVSSALNMTNRETALASRAAQSVIEELAGLNLDEHPRELLLPVCVDEEARHTPRLSVKQEDVASHAGGCGDLMHR